MSRETLEGMGMLSDAEGGVWHRDAAFVGQGTRPPDRVRLTRPAHVVEQWTRP